MHKLFVSLFFIGCLTPQALATPPVMPDRESFNGVFPVAAGATTLTVAGGGIWDRIVYEPGQQPSLTGVKSDGSVLPDGRYKFEFRSVESVGDAVEYEGSYAKSGDDSVNQVKQNVITGRFTVSGGQVTLGH